MLSRRPPVDCLVPALPFEAALPDPFLVALLPPLLAEDVDFPAPFVAPADERPLPPED
jgi:hypothetical protein